MMKPNTFSNHSIFNLNMLFFFIFSLVFRMNIFALMKSEIWSRTRRGPKVWPSLMISINFPVGEKVRVKCYDAMMTKWYGTSLIWPKIEVFILTFKTFLVHSFFIFYYVFSKSVLMPVP